MQSQCTDLGSCLAWVLTDPNVLKNLESLAKIAALIIAGWWTYILFIRRREKFPRAELAHHVENLALPRHKRLIRVAVEVKNLGSTIIRVSSVDTRLQHVAPMTERELQHRLRETPALDANAPPTMQWYLLARRREAIPRGQAEIEPSESETFFAEFIIDDGVDVLRVYSHLENRTKRRYWARRRESKRGLGWQHITYYRIVPGAADRVASQTSPDLLSGGALPSQASSTEPPPDHMPSSARSPDHLIPQEEIMVPTNKPEQPVKTDQEKQSARVVKIESKQRGPEDVPPTPPPDEQQSARTKNEG